VAAAAPAVELFFNSRSVKGHTSTNFDGAFLAPQVRMKAVGGCSGFPVVTAIARTEGARIRDHIDMCLFHCGKGAVGLAVVTALTCPLPVNAVEEDVTVVSGDDDFFPSFQLGYFATSAIARSNKSDRRCR
jgi:hypothetical protein